MRAESPRIAIRGLFYAHNFSLANRNSSWQYPAIRPKQIPTIQPWNDWYHITIHVYGSWLRGDPRGWRARHHREHVEGDYKNPPPPGTYDHLFELSKALMKREPVKIAAALRQFIAYALAEKLAQDSIEVIVISVDAKHVHILARFPDHNPRHWVGRAKKHASHSVRQHGLRTEEGGLWAKRCHPEPIASRAHELRAAEYIVKHFKKGARIWRCDYEKRFGRKAHG